jgi:hypothetical protein
MAEWVDGTCLRLALATALQRHAKSVPDPTPDFAAGGDWFESYNERLKSACGVRLEEIPPGACPPLGRTTWLPVCAATRQTTEWLLASTESFTIRTGSG